VVLLLVALSSSLLLLWLSLIGLHLLAGTPFAGGEWMKSLATRVQEWTSASASFVLIIGSSAVALSALWGLFRSGRRGASANHHVLVSDEQGLVLVDTQGVEAVACAAALRAPGVVEADVRARGTGGTQVRLVAVVGVHPGASINEAGRAARSLMRKAVEELVGLRVSDAAVSVRVLDPEALGRGLP
jgi:hypothetical protein